MHFKVTKALMLATCALSLYTANATAKGTDAHDSVNSEGGKIVVTKQGSCVRTKWQAATDVCAPEPVKEVVVAAPAPTPPPAPKVALQQRTVYFDFNKTTLNAEGTSKLDNLVDIIHKSQGIRQATVLGYADAIGSQDYNLALSQKRANVVQQYLATRVSIPTNVLMVNGKGATDSVTNCPKTMKRAERITCLAQDRRVEIEFNYVE